MLEVLHCMTCVRDTIMLCSVILFDMLICHCMMKDIIVSCVGLSCLIDHDDLLWPRGSGFEAARRNMLGPGCFGGECVSLVNRVLAYQVT